MTRIVDLTLAALGDAIRTRAISSEEATRAAIAQIEALQPTVNAFISLRAEAAIDTARARDAELGQGRWRGPLHGVPLAHKDMYYRAGHTVTCGSAIQIGRAHV